MPLHRRQAHVWEGWQEEEAPWGMRAVVAFVVAVAVGDDWVLVGGTSLVAAVVALVPVEHA